MDETALRALVAAVATGEVGPDEAVSRLRRLPFADLGFARVDHHRMLRTGLPEAVYAPGKTAEQCAALVGELLDGAGGRPEGGGPGEHGGRPGGGGPGEHGGRPEGGGPGEHGGPVLLTRADAEQAAAALSAHPDGVVTGDRHRLVAWRPAPPRPARVVVVSAGTADLPVADECAATLTALGLPPQRLTDVGVAGVHRLLADVDVLAEADAIVVVAGMEGALASVVGGLTAAPVVAVPTSVGYGASLEGVTALLAMLSSCAAGITVVGIDNGYGAACALSRLLAPVSTHA